MALIIGLSIFIALASFWLWVSQIFDAIHAPAAQDERKESASS